jgi:hypothetical protein
MSTDPKETPTAALPPSPEAGIAKPGAGTTETAGADHLDAYRFGEKRAAAPGSQPEKVSDANAKSFVSADNFQIDQSVDDAFNSIGAVEKDGKKLTDKNGNVYRRSGTDVAIRSKDGSTTYIKKGDQQELATSQSEQLYNARTLDAAYRDRATGTELLNSKAKHTFEMRTVGGGETRVAVDGQAEPSSAIGRQLGYDKQHNPLLTENIGAGSQVSSQVVIGQGEAGQTKVTVHASDFSVEREGDTYKFFGAGGVPLKDAKGNSVVMTKDELLDLDRRHELPPKLAAKLLRIDSNNGDLVFNGIKIHRDGYEHDRTTVVRDRHTGGIKATILNADHQGHDEIDTIDKDHARVQLKGVFNTEIKNGTAVTTDANQKVVATYDYATGTYTTKEATFSSKGTDVKFAGAHVDAESGSVTNSDGSKADAGSPAAVAVTASAADASANAQALAARANADAKSAVSLAGAIDATSGNLAALAAACQDNPDALQYVNAGLDALDSARGALGVPGVPGVPGDPRDPRDPGGTPLTVA